MKPEKALALSFIGSIAATLALAAMRSLLGDQAANCITLAALWAVFYKSLGPKAGPGRRMKPKRPRK